MLKRILMTTLPASLVAMAVHAAPVVDGLVGGFAEGYTQGYTVQFDVENGPTGVGGGFLYLDDTATDLTVGFVAPLTINDNTYGANIASDWTRSHSFKDLLGSDQWELVLPIIGGKNVSLKLDYIESIGSGYDAVVKEVKEGKTKLDATKVSLETSMSYNYEALGLTQYFGDGLDSPATSDGNYGFLPPASNWVAEIMYEFTIDKSILSNAIDFAALGGDLGIFHMSPNKQGGNKVFAYDNPIPLAPPVKLPEPVTVLLLGFGLAVLGVARRRRVIGRPHREY